MNFIHNHTDNVDVSYTSGCILAISCPMVVPCIIVSKAQAFEDEFDVTSLNIPMFLRCSTFASRNASCETCSAVTRKVEPHSSHPAFLSIFDAGKAGALCNPGAQKMPESLRTALELHSTSETDGRVGELSPYVSMYKSFSFIYINSGFYIHLFVSRTSTAPEKSLVKEAPSFLQTVEYFRPHSFFKNLYCDRKMKLIWAYKAETQTASAGQVWTHKRRA